MPVVAAPVPDWLKKIAEELPVLAAFIRAECGPVGWEHTVNVWAERLQEYVSVPASAARIQELEAALRRIADYGLSDEAITPERDEFSTPEDQTIHAWVRRARSVLGGETTR